MMMVIAPAKRMRSSIDFMEAERLPVYMEKSQQLVQFLQTKSQAELKQMLHCNDGIAQWTYNTYRQMNLMRGGAPALLSYDGIQYSYMAPDLFNDACFAYVKKHLRILSGLYGILHPFDSVVPYRLELDTPFHTAFCRSLYDFWGDLPYRELVREDKDILDLSSKQYGKIIKQHMTADVHCVTVFFLEEEDGKRREKGVYVKMARGEMVRWLAEENIQRFEDVKGFCRMGYRFDAASSDAWNYRFVRKVRWRQTRDL